MPYIKLPAPDHSFPALQEFLGTWAPEDPQLQAQFKQQLLELFGDFMSDYCVKIVDTILPAILEQERRMQRHQNG
jgi:hypothetical protein